MPMGAMILAAGRGERMRPLSDTTPKPLLEADGKSLIAAQIEALARAGFRDIVINVSHLPERFVAALGNGTRLGVTRWLAVDGSAGLGIPVGRSEASEQRQQTVGTVREAPGGPSLTRRSTNTLSRVPRTLRRPR